MRSDYMIVPDEDLYELIERAVAENKPLWPNGEKLRLIMMTPTKFLAENVYWMDADRNVYRPMLEALYIPRRYDLAGVYVVGSVSLDGSSSGITKMFKPENRYKMII